MGIDHGDGNCEAFLPRRQGARDRIPGAEGDQRIDNRRPCQNKPDPVGAIRGRCFSSTSCTPPNREDLPFKERILVMPLSAERSKLRHGQKFTAISQLQASKRALVSGTGCACRGSGMPSERQAVFSPEWTLDHGPRCTRMACGVTASIVSPVLRGYIPREAVR